MKYNPAIHHRKSIRLKGYDYSQNGAYFITICTHGKECLFGNGYQLNVAGKMIKKWWVALESKFTVVLDEFVIMPNHFHGIIIINSPVGANQCVCPINECVCPIKNKNEIDIGQTHGSAPTNHTHTNHTTIRTDQPINRPTDISKIIQWFKTMTTNEYIRGVKTNKFPRFEKSFWQRNYYEHIIRSEKSLHAIREYIRNNPANWQKDELFTT